MNSNYDAATKIYNRWYEKYNEYEKIVDPKKNKLDHIFKLMNLGLEDYEYKNASLKKNQIIKH